MENLFVIKKDSTIQDLASERDKLDAEIKKFRETVLHPTRQERRSFVKLKELRKKLQHEIRVRRRKERRAKEKALHESLNAMTKDEMKEWRVLTHKIHNIELNFLSIQNKIKELMLYTKFNNLCMTLEELSETFSNQLQYYKSKVNDIENVVTKQYYRDHKNVMEYKQSHSESTENIR